MALFSGFVSEFKTFAVKGNMIDMAVGIIIGAAFGKIITSLVSEIIMPPIGLLLGGVDFKNFFWVIKDAVGTQPAVMIKYGSFINTIIDFLIIALSVFIMVKMINSMRKKQEEAPAPAPAPTNEEVLLTEIRDILKDR